MALRARRASMFGRAAVSTAVAMSVVLACSSLTRTGWGQEPPPTGDERPGDQPQAGAIDLLRSAPFDRITLNDGSVLYAEPISPRPLPEYDPKKDRISESKRLKGVNEGFIKVGDPDQPTDPAGKSKRSRREESSEDLDPNNMIAVHLLQAQGQAEMRDFKVRRALIKRIDYFEDLLLAESDRLIQSRKFAQAFECLLFLKARSPDWQGQADGLHRLLFAEGSAALTGGDFERGVRLLRELLERKKDYPGLVDQLADAYNQRAERALELGLYARGREILHRFEEMAPNHQKYLDARGHYVSTASRRLESGKGAGGSDRLDAIADALRIWPALDGADALYEKAFGDTPTLDVGVIGVPSPLGPWIRSPADARTTRLLYRPLLHSEDNASLEGKPPGQLAAKVESTELGRQLVIRLRSGAIWSDGSRPVSAIDVARTLIDRTDPHSPRYRARWADLLERVETPDEARVNVRFYRSPIRVGSWFTGPVGPAHASEDGRVATAGAERTWVTDGPFRCVSSSPDLLELNASEAASAGSGEGGGTHAPRIKRLREFRIADGSKAVAAIIRGEISMLEHVPTNQVAALRNRPEIRLGAYQQLMLHRIAFDGRNPALRNRSLKRGLSYAIDRKGLLEGQLLKRPADDRNLVSDGPVPRGSFADAPGVKPFEYNPMLAQMLLAAARKELGGSPISLKFEYPDLPEARTVVPLIVEAFRVVGEKSGLKIEPIERRESELELELRGGRQFDLAYRATPCADAISDLGLVLCPGLDAPAETDPLGSAASPRILQLLLELERASEFPTARGIATQIDREANTELPILPLWQLERFYAWRNRLKGVPDSADRLYETIEQWEIQPWFARDPWMAKKG